MRSNGLLKWLMIPSPSWCHFVGIRLFSGWEMHVGAARQRCWRPAHARRNEGVGHREAIPARHRGHARRPRVSGCALEASRPAYSTDVQIQRRRTGACVSANSDRNRRISSALESRRSNHRERDNQGRAASARQQTEGLTRRPTSWRLDNIVGAGGRLYADLPDGPGAAGGRRGQDGRRRHALELNRTTQKACRGTQRGRGFAAGGVTDELRRAERVANHGRAVANARARAAGVKNRKASIPSPRTPRAAGLGGDDSADRACADRRHRRTTRIPSKVLVGPGQPRRRTASTFPMAGAVFNNTASGDWTLSCVRGQVRSITFSLQRRHDSHDPRRPRRKPAE